MPSVSRPVIKKRVEQRITVNLLKEIVEYVHAKDPYMWGEVKPGTFVSDMVILTLYHYFTGSSYQNIEEEIDFGYVISHNSLAHNAGVIRRTLQPWAEQYVTLGTLTDWQEAASGITFPKPIGKVHLWTDSTDVRLKGRQSVSRKDLSWSFKCNSPAQRYMMLCDAKSRVRYLCGGYSPKVYDGDWLKINKAWIASSLHGATVIADGHFAPGRTLLPGEVTFLVNYPQPAGPQLNAAGGIGQKGKQVHLTQELQHFNNVHRSARARVESPFARLKKKFISLDKPWYEDPIQQDYLVHIGCAIINNLKH